MNLLDENFPSDQAALLREWRIPHRLIGRDISHYGVQDSNIIPLLHRLKRATLFTQDQDFFKQELCHPAYGLVWLDGRPGEMAFQLRRFLRHPESDTQAKRLLTVNPPNGPPEYPSPKRFPKTFHSGLDENRRRLLPNFAYATCSVPFTIRTGCMPSGWDESTCGAPDGHWAASHR